MIKPDGSLRLVVLESPYAGDVERNVAYAKRCVWDCITRFEAPIASHLLFTQPGILRDHSPAERALGMACGHAWIPVADAVVVYADYGVSAGMDLGMTLARQHGVAVEVRYINCAQMHRAQSGTDATGKAPQRGDTSR